MLLSKLFKVSYFRISSHHVPIHDLSFRRSPALPPPRLQAPSSRLPSSTLSSTLSSTHRLVESGPTPARRHWAASPRVSVPGARHTNHGTRITERDAVERHLGADPFRVRDLAMRPRPRGRSHLQFRAHVQAHDHGLHVLDRICSWLKRRSTSQPPSGRVDGIVRRPCCVGSESMMRCPRSAACITATIVACLEST